MGTTSCCKECVKTVTHGYEVQRQYPSQGHAGYGIASKSGILTAGSWKEASMTQFIEPAAEIVQRMVADAAFSVD